MIVVTAVLLRAVAEPALVEKREIARTRETYQADAQILRIETAPDPRELLVLTLADARWYAPDGNLLRTVAFPKSLWAPFTATLDAAAGRVFVGLRQSAVAGLGESAVEVLDLEGRRLLTVPAWKYGDVSVADVLGDDAPEILIRQRDGVRVHDARGRLVADLRAAGYVYQALPFDADGDGKDDVLFWMGGRKGYADVQVLSGAGREIARWRQPEAERISVLRPGPGERSMLASVAGDSIRILKSGGAVVKTYAAPGAGDARYLQAGRLAGGMLVVLGVGGGPVDRSTVWAFDSSDALVYSDHLTERAWAMHASERDNVSFSGSIAGRS
jgi:hypothetical protein